MSRELKECVLCESCEYTGLGDYKCQLSGNIVIEDRVRTENYGKCGDEENEL